MITTHVMALCGDATQDCEEPYFKGKIELASVAYWINNADLPIIREDISQPGRKCDYVIDGAKYTAEELGIICRALANRGYIVKYYEDGIESPEYIAYCGWPLWLEWIQDDPAIDLWRIRGTVV